MVQVDISNVWGAFSLPEFLEMEQVIAEAHSRQAQKAETEKDCPAGEWNRIQKIAEEIRGNFEICVVVGSDAQTLAARGILTLVQGSHRNLRIKPAMLFTGHSFSSAHFQELSKTLEGKNYCVLAISDFRQETAPALALRSLRWTLERKYGCEGARKRIFALVGSESESLYAIAQQGRWECAICSGTVAGLPGQTMAILTAAGIDTKAIAAGAERGKEAFDLRSFENPVWLYAAARTLLGQKGKTVEVLESSEPDFALLGRWWQNLFAGQTGVVYAQFPTQTQCMEGVLQSGFVTRLRFAGSENPTRIVPDLQNADGLNCLMGISLDTVAEKAMDAMVQRYQDRGISIIGIDCDTAGEETLGQLIFFMELSRKISAEIPSGKQGNWENKPDLQEEILQLFAENRQALPE